MRKFSMRFLGAVKIFRMILTLLGITFTILFVIHVFEVSIIISHNYVNGRYNCVWGR